MSMTINDNHNVNHPAADYPSFIPSMCVCVCVYGVLLDVAADDDVFDCCLFTCATCINFAYR